ncbi:MAG: glycoside hydrolase family 75 protein [Chthoniobacterales bacterium]|nr:glycoside hydrolase family 75 protein [Chthoniobacterales bacterium]
MQKSPLLRMLRTLVLLLLSAILLAIVLRWVSLERWKRNLARSETIPVRPLLATPTPSPDPTRPPVIRGRLETARLFSGITLHTAVEPTPGGPASVERVDPQSYVLDLKLQVRVPQPNATIEELSTVNSELPRLLPGLAALMTPQAVSPFFAEMYERKVNHLRTNIGRLDQLLSRHNFYDVQTILDFTHPETNRRAVLIQSEMDVDADGSDADRMPQGAGIFPNFQPATSYRWPKQSTRPNPYVSMYEERIKRYETELAQGSANAARKQELNGAIRESRSGIDQLKRFSFLIGTTDPFIVVPGGFNKAKEAKVGDYAVVIHGDRIFPSIVGDVGPSDKAGEASLRIAKEINPAATPFNRPVSDLKVTYLIFPGTAETPFGPPDLDKIHARCEELVKEIGGAGVPLHRWENIIPPLPTPTPSPSPTPTASPTPSPGESPAEPAASPPPTASPAPTFAFPLPSPSPTPTATPSPKASPKTKTKPKS